jgi:EAL domain-containing protein (putative c-di-GMP-specific phosphodiesterase class I)
MSAIPLRADGTFSQGSAISFGGGALLGPSEQLFADLTERCLRHPKDRRILVLHLSRLPPPGVRPHHLRVVRLLFQDAAQRSAGQFVVLPTLDAVMFCAPRDASDGAPDAIDQLVQTLPSLFAADMPDPARLVSVWRPDEDPDPFIEYATQFASQIGSPPAPDPSNERPIPPASLPLLEEIADITPLIDALAHQTGMLLGGDRKLPLNERLSPAFRHIAVSDAALQLRPAADAMRDPFLHQHVMARLHHRLLRLLEDDIRAEGRLTRFSKRSFMPIHIGLGLETVLSPTFAHVSRLAGNAGLRLGIEVGAMPAVVAIDLLDHARSLLNMAGCQLILGPFEAAALEVIQLDRLRPDLVKLRWQPSLAEGGPGFQQRLAAALARAGAAQIVLYGVDSETAISWGRTHGIRLYQGPFLDQAQAAARMGYCPGADSCTLRQCATRAGALGAGGRAGCTQPALLESAELRIKQEAV